MTRSNLHIKLSNGKSIICVADSDSGPEQGYIVERLILPLLELGNCQKELALLSEYCTMGERRCNAKYRYVINLVTKEVRLFEERFNYEKWSFRKPKDITGRYNDYIKSITSA